MYLNREREDERDKYFPAHDIYLRIYIVKVQIEQDYK